MNIFQKKNRSIKVGIFVSYESKYCMLQSKIQTSVVCTSNLQCPTE